VSKFKKALKKKELWSALAKHPLRELDEAVKKDYVKGLVFIAIEDENFSEEEKAYITSLMSNIGVDEALLSEFESFANEPDEDELLVFMDRIKAFDEDLKVNFLIEVVLLAFKDGDFDDAEKEMFNDYVEMLELEEKKDDIMHLALALENKDIDLALAMYTAKKEFFMKYDYMFDMIYIDIEKELNDVYSWEWVEFRLEKGEVENNNLVASKPVTNRQFCIFLNSSLISGDLKQVVNTTQFEINNEVIIKDIGNANLSFDKLFSYEKDVKDDDIVGIESVDSFLEFVNSKTQNSVKWLKIIAESDMIKLEESAKGLLTDNLEKFLAYANFTNWSGSSVKDLIRYINIDEHVYNSYRGEHRNALEEDKNYTFRLMQIKEEEQ